MKTMAKLRKGNRIIQVEGTQVEGYLARGYDEINKDGKVTKSATGGKTISLAEHNKVLKENEDLKAKAKDFADRGKELEAENKELKSNKNKK